MNEYPESGSDGEKLRWLVHNDLEFYTFMRQVHWQVINRDYGSGTWKPVINYAKEKGYPNVGLTINTDWRPLRDPDFKMLNACRNLER